MKIQRIKKSAQEVIPEKEKTIQLKNEAVQKQGIKRQYLKTKNKCRVTFKLPKPAAPTAISASIVGDFNNWDINTHVMKKLKAGGFSTTLELDPGKEYQFRYFIDNSRWENDWKADKYVSTPFGSENSVLVL